MMTNKDVIVNELNLHGCDTTSLGNVKLFTEFCYLHNDNCDGCPFSDTYCPIGIETDSRLKNWLKSGFDNNPALTLADYIKKAFEVEGLNDQ